MSHPMILLNISNPALIAFACLMFGIITLCCVCITRLGDEPSRSPLYYCIPIIWGMFFVVVTLFTTNYWILVISGVLIFLPIILPILYRRHQDQIIEHELRTWSGKLGEQPLTLKDIKELAESRGGTLISDQFINIYKKLRWKCGNGHDWDATPSAVYRGHWCPLCTWQAEFTDRRDKLQTLQRIAIGHSGMCLSTLYINESTSLQWQCAQGHHWDARPEAIRKGMWCPKCTNIPR